MDVITLCFSEKLPAAGNLAFILEGNDLIWNKQGFPPQIQRAGLTTVHVFPYEILDLSTKNSKNLADLPSTIVQNIKYKILIYLGTYFSKHWVQGKKSEIF